MLLHDTKHILWHDERNDIYILDGPASILAAQGPELGHAGYILSSTPARTEPYASQEPKNDAARQRLLQANGDQHVHSIYAELIDRSLTTLASANTGPWMLPRHVTAITALQESARQEDFVEFGEPIDLALGTFTSNGRDCSTVLRTADEPTISYLLPRSATFMLADCTSTTRISNFYAEIRGQAAEAGTSWKFDLMILDPPWNNRSVKRKRGAYSTIDKSGIDDMLARMDLDRLMSVGCIVAVWITNKASARESVLGDAGFFDSSGVDLIEEWIWIKVTEHGQPLSDVRGIWRKPYEVLLIGRRRAFGAQQPHVALRRRVMFSVPDLHSRKPCLKHLFEKELLHTTDYRALEVFARHLVADWWSWGNECLKFNALAHWHKLPSTQLDHFGQEQPKPARS